MRILIVSQYFWPEQFVINDLAVALASSGHVITVATGKPNYPTGRIWPGYHKEGVTWETYSGSIEVIRVPLRPRGRAGAFDLLLNYASFVVSGLKLPRLLRGRSFDVVFFFGVSPMTAAIPAVILARVKKAHLALWLQDLWPESLVGSGLVTNRIVLNGVELMMRLIYRSAQTLLLQSRAFSASVERLTSREKIFYLPNPAPIEGDYQEDIPREVKGFSNSHFTVVFAGNLGRAQALDTVLGAASLLRVHPNIRIMLVGTGSEADNVRRKVITQGLDNVVLAGPFERSAMAAVYRNANVLLVTLRDEVALNSVIPSKIQAYMQAGKPIIGALNGEGARLIQESKCGLVVKAQDSESLARCILTMSSMPASTLEAMGQAGRSFFLENFEVGNVAQKLTAILENRLGNKSD
ncbi:glycosyltransferase family 4 protein [Pseudorhizobium flavum]|uniref:glycosyltransferase family 4 protein n=1 Tax=Pseudorhizobium flavum TaxID=1335061 RepID=UPI00376F62BC